MLLEYLADGAGKRLITGVHTQTNPMEEREYIKKITGCYPKLVEFEEFPPHSRDFSRELGGK